MSILYHDQIVAGSGGVSRTKLEEALSAKQDKLRGLPGQVVGFDAAGGPVPVQGWSNQNLLLNWYFRNPVNRLGQLEYAGFSHGYTIDRWAYHSDNTLPFTLTSQGISFRSEDAESYVEQSLERFGHLKGKTVTYSVLGRFTGKCALVVYGSPDGIAEPPVARLDFEGDGEITVKSITFAVPDVNLTEFKPRITAVVNASIAAAAVKLELGGRQTLARKNENGEWELVDAPDYDLEYVLCSQYNPMTGAWIGYPCSNPNLLDNWYFADPVNQRGMTKYEGTGYAIDRWRNDCSEGIVSVVDGGIRIESDYTVGIAGRILFRQIFENIPAGVYTASVLVTKMSGDWAFGCLPLSNSKIFSIGLNTYTHTRIDSTNKELYIWKASGNADDYIEISAIKLERGPVQTLARRDADGNWVLNDPPPNKALELLKCQRYYQVFATSGLRPSKAEDFRPPMRVTPTLGTVKIDNVTYYTADADL